MTHSTIRRLTKPFDKPKREFQRLRRAACHLQQNESLAIARRNLFDDEVSTSNNTGAKPPTPPRTIHEHSHPNSSSFQIPIILPAEQTGGIIDARDILKLDQFAQFRFGSLTEEEGWNRIEEYVQYQDDLWNDISPPMSVSSISEAMRPTFRGRLKKDCNQISFLETPIREVGLKNPYLNCDYCGGSHETNECKQTNLAEQVCLSGGDIYDDPILLRLKKQKKDDEDERLLSILKQIHINLPFLEAMIHMPKGGKVLKDLISHKEKLEKAASSVKLSEECSAIIQRSLHQKEGDLGSFTLPCLIEPLPVKNALADLGASINLMPHSLFRRLGISKLKHTKMSIQLADRSIKYPIGVCENLLVKISKFIFPIDFVVLEMDEDELVPIILGRPFLATARAVSDVHKGKLSLRVESETVTFNIGKSMKSKHSRDDYLYCADHTAKLVQEQ
ncbi:reverse transcriptase [Tanacetum coccineum]|uniref:Reverse transcriptase n=1 Tax=Tanacetum coccineum TaxID=301880 RepID=A0ABQ5GFC0_9ASTR